MRCWRSAESDPGLPAFLHRRRVARRRRHRPRSPRVRREVLYRGRQLGPGRQQHAVFFIRDGIKFPTSSTRRSRIPSPTAGAGQRLGLLLAYARATHQFTWLFGDRGIPLAAHMDGFGFAHFSVGQLGGRALLGEVPLQRRTRASRCLTSEEGAATAGIDRRTTRRTVRP